MLEFKSFKFPLIDTAMIDLPVSPGAVERDVSGRAALLHIGPGRFLVPEPTSDLVRRLDTLQAAGIGALFDIDGKWRAFALTGPSAERILLSTIDLSQVLATRDCAALRLFDCPAVLARRSDAFDVWVEASYAGTFRERVRAGGYLCD